MTPNDSTRITRPPPSAPPGPRDPLKAGAAAAALFLLAALPVIVTATDRGRGAWDDIVYHRRTIAMFAEQWPNIDLSDYLSATTPGYHLALAGAARSISDSPMFLRLIGASFTAALLALLAGWCASRVGWKVALALALPMIGSVYVFSSGAWLLPDNLGWLGVLAVLLLALRERFTWREAVASGVIVSLLVFVRQAHLWTAGVVWAAAWVSVTPRFPPDSDDRAGVRAIARSLFADPGRRIAPTLVALVATLPAFAIILSFYRLWGGLTPPTFQADHQSFNPATPAFILALLGALGAFFLPVLWTAAAGRDRRGLARAAAIGASIALVVALIPHTTYDKDAGRYSGLWSLARDMPSLAGRSAAIVGLATLGGLWAGAWALVLPVRARWIMLAALAAFSLAQAANHDAWQRYNEPMVLMLLAIASALTLSRPLAAPPEASPRGPLRLAIGPAALGLALAASTALILYRAAPVSPDTPPPPRHQSPPPGGTASGGTGILPVGSGGTGVPPV